MKAKILIVLAAVAMLFIACGKEEGNSQIGNNELVYHGTVYKMNCDICYGTMADLEDAYMIDGVQADGNLFSFIADARVSTVNHTYNIPDGIPGEGKLDFFVAAEGNSPVPELSIEAGSFKSGTVTITYDDEAFIFEVDATLKDDTHFGAKIYQEKPIENCW